MKGSVYGGVLYLPQHPYADIHGLVRAVMRTKSPTFVSLALEQLNVVNPSLMFRNGIWGESGSAVEKLVTEGHYGEMLVCPLVSAYLDAAKYERLLPESLKVLAKTGEIHTSVGREAYPKAYKG
jgi:hypothetical protein